MREEIFGFGDNFNCFLTDSKLNCNGKNDLKFKSNPPEIKELSEVDLFKGANIEPEEVDTEPEEVDTEPEESDTEPEESDTELEEEKQDISINIYDFKFGINEILNLDGDIEFNDGVIITGLNNLEENLEFSKKKVSLIIDKFDFLPLIGTTKDGNTMFSINLGLDNLFYTDNNNLGFLDILINSLKEKGIFIEDIKKIYFGSIKYQHLNVDVEKFKEFWEKLDYKIGISKISNIRECLDGLGVLDLTLFTQLVLQAYGLEYSKICRYYERMDDFKEEAASLILKRKIK